MPRNHAQNRREMRSHKGLASEGKNSSCVRLRTRAKPTSSVGYALKRENIQLPSYFLTISREVFNVPIIRRTDGQLTIFTLNRPRNQGKHTKQMEKL